MAQLKVSAATLVAQARARISEIETADLIAAVDDPDTVIVDIRDIRERKKTGFIPGSVHAPRGMLEFWIDPDSPYYREVFGQPGKRYVLQCASGWRSALATAALNDMGFEAAHLKDGFSDWSNRADRSNQAMDEPIRYMERTRAYYRALGYGPAYRWAQYADVPFCPAPDLRKARVAIVTTAAPFRPELGDQGPGAPYNAAAKFYQVYEVAAQPVPDLRISHVAIDRDHTAAADPGSYLPVAALDRAATAGRIGSTAHTVYGLPTNRSQRRTIDVDCPDLVARMRGAGIEAAILVPNCPVCHQSCALAARALEAEGVATVIMGCALDILEHVGVPRALFSDFPLGNAAGRPDDVLSQDQTLALALDLLEQAHQPRRIERSPLVWPGDGSWRLDYANADNLSESEIAQRRLEFDAAKETARNVRETPSAREPGG